MRIYTVLNTLICALVILHESNAINSYIYLPDKNVTEEIPIGTVVIDLSDELNAYYRRLSSQPSATPQQYTFLEDVKHAQENSYFLLDSSTGRVRTRRFLDRETLCLNRHCIDPCDPSYARNSCKINMKVLLVPSYVILSLNILIQDINDNAPRFRVDTLNQSIPENVPIGYRVPIDLAFDPDFGKNSMQYYAFKTMSDPIENQLINETFELVQNLNESQLALVVKKNLDRETVASYHFVIVAYDGGMPPFTGELQVFIEVADVNDNNPKFTQDTFKFSILEDTQVGAEIGKPIQATDADSGLNGKIRYSIVNIGSSGTDSGEENVLTISYMKQQDNHMKYFEINQDTGVLRLKHQLDYETAQFYSLTIEAKDCGIGSLPAYANVEIYVIDVNDNSPEISVSFLNSLRRNTTEDNETIVYVPENMKPNRYIAHVSIFDKDSHDNGKVDWILFLNDTELKKSDNTHISVNKLNNNSFTINSGSKPLDRELFSLLHVSVFAWDFGTPRIGSFYNFSLVVLDENDNAAKFEQANYAFKIEENNELSDVIGRVNAVDADYGENGRITYSIKEPNMQNIISIDDDGTLRAQRRFDSEKNEVYLFHVVANDNGKPMQTAEVSVKLSIIDKNDNAPTITTNSTYANHEQLPDKNLLVFSLYENLPIGTEIARFFYSDPDKGSNGLANFYMEQRDVFVNQPLPFKLTSDGLLTIDSDLDREKTESYEFTVICQDQGEKSERQSSEIDVLVYVKDINDNCPTSVNVTKNAFINKDVYFDENSTRDNSDNLLFQSTYIDNDLGQNADLKFELLTHDDLFELTRKSVRLESYTAITISFRFKVFDMNLKNYAKFTAQLKIGKYVLRLKISDNGDPMCMINESFVLVVGDNSLNKNGVLNQLKINRDKAQTSMINDNENEIIYSNITSPKTTNLKLNTDPAKLQKANVKTSTLNSNDYLLLVSLIAIVVIIAIFFALIGTVFFYSRYKRSLKKKSKSQIRGFETGKLLSANNSCQGSETHDTNTEILYHDKRYSFSVKSTESDRSNSADSVSSSAYTKETSNSCHIDHSSLSSNAMPQVRSSYKNYTLDSRQYHQMPKVIRPKPDSLDNAHLYSTLNSHQKYSHTREKTSTLNLKYKNSYKDKNPLYSDYDEESAVFVANRNYKAERVTYDYKSSAV
jgi:protocadherin delta 1